MGLKIWQGFQYHKYVISLIDYTRIYYKKGDDKIILIKLYLANGGGGRFKSSLK